MYYTTLSTYIQDSASAILYRLRVQAVVSRIEVDLEKSRWVSKERLPKQLKMKLQVVEHFWEQYENKEKNSFSPWAIAIYQQRGIRKATAAKEIEELL